MVFHRVSLLRHQYGKGLACCTSTKSILWKRLTIQSHRTGLEIEFGSFSSYKPFSFLQVPARSFSSSNDNHNNDANSEKNYQPMTSEEEAAEKIRVSNLTKFQKEMELRDLDDALSYFNTKRGINTGELYTLRGKFKALARDYGIGFMVWYWTIWSSTALLTYGSITLGGVDVISLLHKVDGYTGLEIASKVDPQLGTIALTIAANELLEPVRLPIVVLTTKPVVNFFSNTSQRGR